MTAEWVERAWPWVGDDPTSWVASLAGRSDLPALRADDLTDSMLSDVARAALFARAEKSSVFTQANLFADVERQLHGVLFAPDERTKVSERAVEAALGMSVKLSPPELAHVPERFRAPDGTNQFASGRDAYPVRLARRTHFRVYKCAGLGEFLLCLHHAFRDLNKCF